MLSSIHPLGERARNNRWWLTVTAFVAGATGTAALIGLVLASAGSLIPGDVWRWPVIAGVVAVAALLDLVRLQPPGPHRQVNEDWIGAFRGWVYGGGFGAQLGAGAATYVVTWLVWATAVSAVVVGDPLAGAVVGGAFGAGRSVFPLAAGWIDRPSRLTAFNRSMAAIAVPVTRGLSGAALVLAAVAVLGRLG